MTDPTAPFLPRLRLRPICRGAGFLVAASALGSTLEIDGGRFEVAGRLEADRVLAAAGAALAGSGAIAAHTEVAGLLAPGLLRIEGDLDFIAGAAWRVRLPSQDSADLLGVTGVARGEVAVDIGAPADAVPVHLPILSALPASNFTGFVPLDSGVWSLEETPAGTLTLTRPAGDSDADGLPDVWELLYFSSRTAADPVDDGDGDHASNGAEFAAGTLPGDAESVLRLSDLRREPDGWTVRWPSVAGRTYRLTSGPAPDEPAGIVADDIAATPPVNTLALPPPADASTWLRIEILP